MALEDADAENGPLIYYPGSQTLPEVTMADVEGGFGPDDYPRYEEHISELIEARGLPPQQAHLRRGEALIWAANLLHGRVPQLDPARTRLSQVT